MIRNVEDVICRSCGDKIKKPLRTRNVDGDGWTVSDQCVDCYCWLSWIKKVSRSSLSSERLIQRVISWSTHQLPIELITDQQYNDVCRSVDPKTAKSMVGTLKPQWYPYVLAGERDFLGLKWTSRWGAPKPFRHLAHALFLAESGKIYKNRNPGEKTRADAVNRFETEDVYHCYCCRLWYSKVMFCDNSKGYKKVNAYCRSCSGLRPEMRKLVSKQAAVAAIKFPENYGLEIRKVELKPFPKLEGPVDSDGDGVVSF